MYVADMYDLGETHCHIMYLNFPSLRKDVCLSVRKDCETYSLMFLNYFEVMGWKSFGSRDFYL